MKIEELGRCPCCLDGKKVSSLVVNFFASRFDNGDLEEIYIFGDDDFDVPSSNATVTSVKFSDDCTKVTEVVCPRCKENILVDVPIIKEQDIFFKALPANPVPLVSADQSARQL